MSTNKEKISELRNELRSLEWYHGNDTPLGMPITVAERRRNIKQKIRELKKP